MLDTGATGVAIPEAIARKLDIPRGRPYRTQTANGISTSYAASLDSVAVGEIELRDVQAGIAPGLAMNQILLGMTFLKHIEFTQRGDTLILRQYL
jgi:aspartyl protease family protein